MTVGSSRIRCQKRHETLNLPLPMVAAIRPRVEAGSEGQADGPKVLRVLGQAAPGKLLAKQVLDPQQRWARGPLRGHKGISEHGAGKQGLHSKGVDVEQQPQQKSDLPRMSPCGLMPQ